jgi:hypothetical protein
LEELKYPCKGAARRSRGVVEAWLLDRHRNGATNVELLCDETPEFFVEMMTGARIVVLPLLKDAVTQAGIGVYIRRWRCENV